MEIGICDEEPEDIQVADLFCSVDLCGLGVENSERLTFWNDDSICENGRSPSVIVGPQPIGSFDLN